MFEKVCEILADKFDADASTMTMDTKVKEDLNADSLDVVELMMDLEENFGVTISDEEAAKMSTIGDIVNLHRSKSVRFRFEHEKATVSLKRWLSAVCSVFFISRSGS